jgi:hypothetical protein
MINKEKEYEATIIPVQYDLIRAAYLAELFKKLN